MGKDAKHKHFRNRNQKPYSKDNWKNRKHRNHPRNGDHQKASNRQSFRPKITLREDQVGITEFTSNCEGFTGILKSRFSDFHVNEIDDNNSVLVLNNLTVPQAPESSITEEQLAAGRTQLEALISPEVWEQIEKLAAAKANTPNLEVIEIDVSSLDKEQRTQIHKVLKQLYGGKLVSTTKGSQSSQASCVDEKKKDAENKKFICIMKPKSGRDQRQQWSFPGDYVCFLVHKENMDTGEVAVALADRLNLRPSQVNYCGTKDKRAKTTQKFCIKHRTPSQIVGACKSIRGVHVGNFEFSKETLKLGNLKGNRFRIALRHITDEHSKIVTALNAINERGFINYFGLQRFGNCASVPTYQVGVALLKADYKLACELILKPRDNDLYFMREIRQFWWQKRDSVAAAAMFRNDSLIEKKLLDGLAEFGENDYAAALRRIPRNMLLLYTHAYQSLIFNRIASRRVNKYGLKLIAGDLVYRNKDEQDIELGLEAAAEAVELPIEEARDENKMIKQPIEEAKDENDTSTVVTEEVKAIDGTPSESIFKRKVKPITEADIASGDYTIFDLVLPLPGYDVTFPTNETGQWFDDMLTESGLTLAKLKHNVKTYALMGAYRKVFIKPNGLKWHFCQYTNVEDPLITSDWEQLKNLKLPTATENDTNNSALILQFSLPTAVYATMMLRELMKADTSAMHQTQLELSVQKKNDRDSDTADEVGKLTQENVDKTVCTSSIKDAISEKRKLVEAEDAAKNVELVASDSKKMKEPA